MNQLHLLESAWKKLAWAQLRVMRVALDQCLDGDLFELAEKLEFTDLLCGLEDSIERSRLMLESAIQNVEDDYNRGTKPMLMPTVQSEFESAPAGTHVARAIRLIDMGTQETTFQGAAKQQRKVYIEWELTNEKNSDGQPMTIGKRYTLSSSPKANLRKDLQAWRGKRFSDDEIAAFDIRKILGTACLVSVIKNDRDYSDVDSISQLPKGTEVPALIGDTTYLSLETSDFEPAVYESLSDKLRETIARSPEFAALEYAKDRPAAKQGPDNSQGEPDIPF